MDNQIGIVIEGTNNSIAAFQRLKSDLDAVAVSAQTVGKSQREMATQGRAATAENRALSSSVKASNTAFRRNAVAVRSSRVAVRRWRVEADRAARAGERYRESAELAAVALGLAARNTTAFAKAQIAGAANLERLLIGLDAITGSLDAANAQYRDLILVSRLPGINIENSLRATLQLQALGKTGEESTRIISEFGNALALSGRPPRELGQVINAIRQMAGEGKILQEDIAIITTRIASLIPLMQEAFGGTRAEDVRKFYDALGTPPSQQAQLFLEVMLEGLERLPRAGETAANAIENLFDTAGRVQAQIGSNFLPLVKEATAEVEGALFAIERSPNAGRNIASLEAFAVGLLGVTSAAAGLQAAIKFLGPSLLAFAKGPVGIAAAAAGIAAGAYLAWEVNLTAATEAQLKSLKVEKSRLELFRELQGLIAEGDAARVATREDALEKSVAAANKAYSDQVLVVLEARKALADYNQQTDQLRSSQGARSARGAERTALTLRDSSELEGGLRQAEARLNALNRARLAANRIAVDAAILVENARSQVVDPSDALDQQIDALAQSATEGSTAIARALQQIQNIDTDTGEAGLEREKDIALDIGDELVAIAEATTVKQLDAAKKRVAGLARDRSLIIENETGLQNLLIAAETQFRDRKIALITAAGQKAASERIKSEIEAEREASAKGLIERQKAAQRAREQTNQTNTQLREQAARGIEDITRDLRRVSTRSEIQTQDDRIDTLRKGLERAKLLNIQFNLALEGLAILRESRIAEIERGEREKAAQALLAQTTEVEARKTALILSLDDARTQRQLENIQRVADAQIAALRPLAGRFQAGDASFQSEFNALQELSRLRDEAATKAESLTDAERQSSEIIADLARYRGDVEAQAAARAARAEAASLRERGEAYAEYADSITNAANAVSNRIEDSARRGLDALRLQAEVATSPGQFERAIAMVGRYIEAIETLEGQAFADLNSKAQRLAQTLNTDLDFARQAERVEDFRDAVADVVSDLAQTGFDSIFDSIFDRSQQATDEIKKFTDDVRGEIQLLESDIRRITRFGEDTGIGRARLEEDRDRAVRQLRLRLRETAASQPLGDQRAIQRNIERQQDIRFRLRERREDFDVRIGRFDQDAALRQSRLVEDATRNRERAEARPGQEGFLEQLLAGLGNTISQSLSDRLGDFIASALTSTLPGLLGGLFSGGEGGEPTAKVTITDPIPLQVPPEGLKIAIPTEGIPVKLATPAEGIPLQIPAEGIPLNLEGALSEISVSPDAILPMITGLEGSLQEVTLPEGVRLPPVRGLTGGIQRVVLQMNSELPIIPGLTAGIAVLEFTDDIDQPNLPPLEATIASLRFVDDIDTPTLPSLTAVVDSLRLEGTLPELPPLAATIKTLSIDPSVATPGVNVAGLITSLALEGTLPTIGGLTGTISELEIATGEDAPNPPSVDGITGIISKLALATGDSAPMLPSIDIAGVVNSIAVSATTPSLAGLSGTIGSVVVSPDIDPPTITGLAGTISTLQLATGEDAPNPPSVDGIIGIIDSLSLAPDIDFPTIRIPATAVVAGTGGQVSIRTPDEEDPENPMIDVQEIDGVINATLNKLFAEPVQIAGIINARVRTVGGAGGQGGGGQGEGQPDESAVEDLEEAVTKNYSSVEELNSSVNDLNETMKNVTSGNLDPALGPTPAVSIPDILDRLLEQTGAASPTAQRQFPAFGEALGAHSQFGRGGGGGGGAAQQPAGAIRVNLPTEFFVGLVNIHTELAAQTKQFESINTHLADLRIGLFGTETAALKVQVVQGAVESGGIDPIVDVRAILANFENRGFPIRTEGGEDFFGGLQFADLAPAKLIEASQATPLMTSDEQATTGLATMNELLTQASERPQGNSEDPLYVKLVSDETLKVEVTNQVRSVEATIVNSSPIPVREQGTVQVVVNNTSLTVRIADLGTLLSQLSQQNTESRSFGGQTI